MVFSIGCVTHAILPVPPPTLTGEERVAWFNKLAGDTEKTTTITTCQNFGCSTTVEKEMRLANGTVVTAPEDLLPVVRETSTTAKIARAARRERTNGDRWTEVVLGVVGAAFITMAASDHWNPLEDKASAAIWGSTFVLGLFSEFAARDCYTQSTRHAGEAFHAYTKDLADRLGVCVLGYQLVPCDYTPPPASTPSGPPGANEPPPEPSAPQQHVPDGPVAGN